jgi:hypothetical protein
LSRTGALRLELAEAENEAILESMGLAATTPSTASRDVTHARASSAATLASLERLFMARRAPPECNTWMTQSDPART